ncbi:regulatory protein RecX [Bifidobacterium biavatii]|uniref:Regulatory protein RecX n=1 Tax=Bifidobacterium biavatii DSM 23969 TaxID=1437608 RepID=A0A086ZL78_9BIFI|nr:regulatory protein RecX [Bifidobacterium biavatii]KFI47278.1 regulatory protein RecX [Bifidobacterium biavatii DSM 23969]
MISVDEFLRRHPADPAMAADAGNAEDATVTVGIEESDDGVRTASRDGRGDDGRRRFGRSRRSHSTSRSTSRSSWAAHEANDPSDADACREAALRLLDAAPRSSGTLREKLADRGYDADVAESVIARLRQVHLIDDEAYARSAVRYCVSRLMGGRGALMELSRRGVDRAMAQQVVAQAEAEGMFEEAAWELGRRYAEKTEGMEPERRRRRFWSAGGRKGHNPDTLRRVAQELL